VTGVLVETTVLLLSRQALHITVYGAFDAALPTLFATPVPSRERDLMRH
jgi:hypothetical protein